MVELQSYCIYVFYHGNRPIYVGQTCDFARRLRRHKHDSIRCPNRPLYQYIRSVGWENIENKVIEEGLTQEQAEIAEQDLIDYYGVYEEDKTDCLLNMCRGKGVMKDPKYWVETQKNYNSSEKGKARNKKYESSEKGKEAKKKYRELHAFDYICPFCKYHTYHKSHFIGHLKTNHRFEFN